MHAPATPIIPPDILLLAYRSGVFPMADSREEEEVFWVEPRMRAVLPPDGFHCSRSLARALRSGRFRVTVDAGFDEVIEQCAQPRPGHPETWISRRIAASYRNLFDLGHAHSVECWDGEALAGGLYGVAIDRAFWGESMFARRPNASKVALAWLVEILRRAGYLLLDCQFMTEHLASLGAVEITREHYLALLAEACAGRPACTLSQAHAALLQEAGASSPGKLIAQSLTQTS